MQISMSSFLCFFSSEGGGGEKNSALSPWRRSNFYILSMTFEMIFGVVSEICSEALDWSI